jgi:hypothetical protein
VRGKNMVVEIAAVYITKALLQNLVIPEIGRKLAGKTAEKGAGLKDIKGHKLLQKVGKWCDDHSVSTPEAVERILNEHREDIIKVLEHKGELKDDLGMLIFESVNELKDRIDNAQLTSEDKEFLAEIKKNFDPDKFESRLIEILKEKEVEDQQKLRQELETFFKKMDWGDKLDDINSKLDRVLARIVAIKRDTTDIKKDTTYIKERLDRKFKILCFPGTPEVEPIFVDRETHLEDLKNSLDKKNMIVIQGIAGIGKTQLAAKLKQTIENDYKTFWMQLDGSDKLDTVARPLACFLKKDGDTDLFEYLECGDTDHETIMNLLLSGLNNKNYVLFFDDYHKVENREIHDLFRQLKDQLNGSTIVITTRNPPPFVSQIDRVKKKVTETGIEGFDLEATKDYLEQMGVEVSLEQLIVIDKRIGGHPLSLLMFVSLADRMDVDEIQDNLPETGIEDYLYDEIYDRLIKDEKGMLRAISVFRTPVTSEACVYVSRGEDVKDTLKSLEKTLLVKRNAKREYYLHDLIRYFSYSRIDDPKLYHQRAGEYYAQLEKTPENIKETTYHMIKDAGVVTDEVVKYLIGTPMDPDPFTSFTVLDLLKENEITSPLIFELLNDFTTNPDLTIQKMFIIEYGNFFGKILRINHEKSVDVLRQILGQANPTLLTMLSRSVAKLAYEFPDEACELWKDIIEKGDREVRLYVSYDILDSNLDAKEAAPILEYLIETSEESADLWYAKTALKNWGVLETQEMTFEDYLEKLRKMSIDEKLLYIKQIKGKVAGDFAIEILDKVYLQDPDKVAEVLKLLVKSYYSHPTTMQRIPRIIAKLAKEDINYLKVFLIEHDDNEYIKFVGLRGLDMIKNEIAGENIYALLTPMLADNNPVIRELASILSEEIKTSPTVTESNKEKRLINPKSILGKLNPMYIIKILETDLSTTEPLAFLMSCWALQKAVEGTDPEIILRILKPLNKYDNSALRNIWRLVATTTQKHPSTVLWVANLALKLSVEVKMSAIWVICNVGNLAPQKAIKNLEPLKKMGDPLLCIHLLDCLKDLRDTVPDETKTFFEKLSVHPDGNVRGLAKLLLNGV